MLGIDVCSLKYLIQSVYRANFHSHWKGTFRQGIPIVAKEIERRPEVVGGMIIGLEKSFDGS